MFSPRPVTSDVTTDAPRLGKKPHAKAALRPDGSLELCPPAGSPGSSRSSLIIVTGENPVTIGLLDRVTKKLVKLDPPRCPR